jgi:hypothetical protein
MLTNPSIEPISNDMLPLVAVHVNFSLNSKTTIRATAMGRLRPVNAKFIEPNFDKLSIKPNSFQFISTMILISKNAPPIRKMFSSFRHGLPEPRSQGWLSQLTFCNLDTGNPCLYDVV